MEGVDHGMDVGDGCDGQHYQEGECDLREPLPESHSVSFGFIDVEYR